MVGEFDGQFDIQVSGLMMPLRRHTLTLDDLDLIMLDDLAWDEVDDERPVVQMLDSKLSTAKSSQEIDLDLRDEVRILTPEPVMRLLLNHDNHISRLSVRTLVALAGKLDRLAALHALVDVNLEELLLGDDLLAFARRAAVLHVDDLARAAALVARRLDLLDHGTHLA